MQLYFFKQKKRNKLLLLRLKWWKRPSWNLQKLAEVYPNVPGLIGNKKVVQRLAEEIAVLENKKTTVAMEQGIYELKQVKKSGTEMESFEK